MAVAFDANATGPTVANGATSATSTALTVGTGANRALLAALGLSSTTITSLTATWDNGGTNQAMTSIMAANSGFPTRSVLFGLVAPTSGAKTLAVAWTGSSDIILNPTSFMGVDQTGGATSFPNSGSATGHSTAGALTITSATGNFTLSTLSCNNAISAEGNTSTFQNNTATNVSAAGERATGAATVAHTYTLGSDFWVVIGTDLLAAGAGAAFLAAPNKHIWQAVSRAANW